MNELRGVNQNQGEINNLSRFIDDDYFYKDDSKKPKVSFAPDAQIASGSKDAIDDFMNQRPARGQASGSALKPRIGEKRKSFISNNKLLVD